jgi:hypothetical protein
VRTNMTTKFIVIQCFADGSAFVAETDDREASIGQVVQRAYDGDDLMEGTDRPDETAEAESKAPICAMHNVPMVEVQGKKGPFWSCHQKTDGRWCTYRP